MTDELDVIASLSPEQLVERLNALQLEAEYWQHILADCKASAEALRGVVAGLTESTRSAAALLPGIDRARLEHVDAVIAANGTAMDKATEVIDALEGIVSMSDGRAKALAPVGAALRRAAGLESDAGESGEPS